jgi:hypothetical protein
MSNKPINAKLFIKFIFKLGTFSVATATSNVNMLLKFKAENKRPEKSNSIYISAIENSLCIVVKIIYFKRHFATTQRFLVECSGGSTAGQTKLFVTLQNSRQLQKPGK